MTDKAPWIDRIEWEPDNDKPGQKRAFDEIVASNVDVHIERMDDGMYWMAISKGSERQFVIFSTARNAKIYGRTEAE